MQVVFDHVRDEAKNITTFYFKPEATLKYTAGQYIELSLPHAHPDNRGQKRWFTLSSSPSDPLLSITTKFTADGGSTFKKTLRQLQPGNIVSMIGPMGDFVLPKLLQTPLVFVAGGIGITPFHSMLSWLAANNEERPITMLYGVGGEDEIVFQDTLDKAHQHVTVVVANPSPAWGGERGRITSELIMGIGQPSEDSLVYVSGPEPMTESLSKDLMHSGLNKQQLVVDAFPNYTIAY
ncbi:MAG TPA: FAD-dependent oxidoreductase [Candidatus Dormibacteraeota bacterium]|nr:FAD-dependent oxidoreductase [Candidatus Dormibacteraeota bacterium]